MRVWTWIWMAAAALGVLVPRVALADDYVYDGANRLVKTVKADLVTTYGYDGEGNLVRECSGPTESALTCSDVLKDAGELPKVLGKVTGSNEKLYAHGPEGVAAQRAVNGGAAQAVEYMLADHQGTVRGVTDGAGTVQARLAYDAYGAVRSKTGTSVSDLGYTGEYTGADGVVNLRARSYLPRLGRFLQRDTYVLGGSTTQGLNRYAYVSNNPLKYTDPTGHVPHFNTQKNRHQLLRNELRDLDPGNVNSPHSRNWNGGGVVDVALEISDIIWKLDQEGELVRGRGTRGNDGSLGIPLLDKHGVIGPTSSGHWCYHINAATGYRIAKELAEKYKNHWPGYGIRFHVLGEDVGDGRQGHQILAIDIVPPGGGDPLRLYVDTWAYYDDGPSEDFGFWVGFKRSPVPWVTPNDIGNSAPPLDTFTNEMRSQDRNYDWPGNPQSNPFGDKPKWDPDRGYRGRDVPNMNRRSCQSCK